MWGVCNLLSILKLGEPAAAPIVTRLRQVKDAFRYLLDNPKMLHEPLGLDTGVKGTRVAARVWGRDDGGGGLIFKQKDIDQIVTWSLNPPFQDPYAPPMSDDAQVILSLAISDLNKKLLLKAPSFISLLVNSVLLGPEHPRRANDDFEAEKGPAQRVSCCTRRCSACARFKRLTAFRSLGLHGGSAADCAVCAGSRSAFAGPDRGRGTF